MDDDGYQCTKIYDYSKHNFMDIIANDWDSCDISDKTVTYNDAVYQKCEQGRRDTKAFLWREKIHINDISDKEVRKESSKES